MVSIHTISTTSYKCLGTTTEDKDTADLGEDFGKDLEDLFAEDGDTDPTG